MAGKGKFRLVIERNGEREGSGWGASEMGSGELVNWARFFYLTNEQNEVGSVG